MTTNTLPTMRDKVATIRDLVEKNREQIKNALPQHLPVERMIRVFFTALSINPKLYECSQRSLMGAMIQCAQLGLEPGVLGYAYLVPFKNDVQFIPGYKGLVDLARRSGEVASVQARVVYESDKFTYSYGLNEELWHVPSGEQKPGEMTHVYAVVRLKDAGSKPLFEVMTTAQINAHRDRYSRAAQNGPWVTAYEEMAKKTVLRRLLKLAPVSIEAQRAVVLSEAAEQQMPQNLGDAIELPDEPQAPAEEPKGALEALTDQLQGETQG